MIQNGSFSWPGLPTDVSLTWPVVPDILIQLSLAFGMTLALIWLKCRCQKGRVRPREQWGRQCPKFVSRSGLPTWPTENISPGIKVKGLIFFIFLHWMPHLVCWVGEEGERDRKIRVGLNTIIDTLFLKLDHCCWNFYTIARLHRNSILYISINADA